MNRTKILLGNIYNILVILTTVTLLSVSLFDKYSSVAIYINFIFVVIGMFFYGRIKGRHLVYIVILTLYLVCSITINGGGYGSVIVFITPLIMITVYSNLRYTPKVKKFLVILGIIVIVGLYLYSIPYGENYLKYLLTDFNPNTLGMFIMFFFMIICVCGEVKNKKSKIGLLFLFVLTLLGMQNYRSRGTALALCCFALMLVLPKKMYGQKSFILVVIALIAVGTSVPFIYLNLYENGYTMEIFGKPLYTGREHLWSEMFALMKDDMIKILFGLGSKVVLWGHDLNVHNNFFNIIVNFGVVGYTVYYAFIVSNIWKCAKYISNPMVRKSLLMFACSVLVLGFSETTSLWAVSFPFAYFGLIMANSECLLQETDADGNRKLSI